MRYIVHGHFENSEGVQSAHWTRTDLGRTAAYTLARAQRAEGGKARVTRG